MQTFSFAKLCFSTSQQKLKFSFSHNDLKLSFAPVLWTKVLNHDENIGKLESLCFERVK